MQRLNSSHSEKRDCEFIILNEYTNIENLTNELNNNYSTCGLYHLISRCSGQNRFILKMAIINNFQLLSEDIKKEFISSIVGQMDLVSFEYFLWKHSEYNLNQLYEDCKRLITIQSVVDEFEFLIGFPWQEVELDYSLDSSGLIRRDVIYFGELAGVGQIVDGQREGEWLDFNLAIEDTIRSVEFESGLPSGKTVLKDEVGRKRIEQSYYMGYLEGVEHIYYANGNPDSICNYENNLPDGICTSYYEDGTVSSTISYSDGLRHGEQIFFTKSGEVESRKCFEFGERVPCPN